MAKHLIHKATIECAVPETDAGVIRDWCTNTLLEMLDKSLEPWHDPERRWIVPALTVDLDLHANTLIEMPITARAYILEKMNDAVTAALQSDGVRQFASVGYAREQISDYIRDGYFKTRPEEAMYHEWMQQWNLYWYKMAHDDIPLTLNQFNRDRSVLRRWVDSLPRKTVIRVLSSLWRTDERQITELWLLTEGLQEEQRDFVSATWWASQIPDALSSKRMSMSLSTFSELLLMRFTTKSNAMAWLQTHASSDMISKLDVWLEHRSGRDAVTHHDVEELLNNLATKSKEELERIEVSCAGVVLLASFIPQWIQETGFGDEMRLYWPEQTPIRLHYLSTGESQCAEKDLLLMKLLCGLEPSDSCDTSFILTADFEREVDELLRAVLGHWERMQNTSIEGLREYFLMRGGRLSLQDGSGMLSIAQAAFDVLLAFVPWNFHTLKLPWMKYLLTVDWS